jgi:O-antigen/teichoic acid export membrane protein
VGTLTAVGLDIILIPRHGITGAGVGWVVGQSLAALVAIRSCARSSSRPRLRAEARDLVTHSSPVLM